MSNQVKYRLDLAALRGFIGTVIGAGIGPVINALMGDPDPAALKRAIAVGLLIGLAAGLGIDTRSFMVAKKNAQGQD
jgi:F0F1-type ATP synthase assembly protein I